MQRIFAGLFLGVMTGFIGWLLLKSRGGTQESAQRPVQWSFDPVELRSIMANVVQQQEDHVMLISDFDAKRRAKAFLTYYENRFRAIAS